MLSNMKIKPFWILLCFVVIITLSVISGILIRDNISYNEKNRVLLLFKDSIISVNIELQNEIEKYRQSVSIYTTRKK